jgi:hypothetical protein
MKVVAVGGLPALGFNAGVGSFFLFVAMTWFF